MNTDKLIAEVALIRSRCDTALTEIFDESENDTRREIIYDLYYLLQKHVNLTLAVLDKNFHSKGETE